MNWLLHRVLNLQTTGERHFGYLNGTLDVPFPLPVLNYLPVCKYVCLPVCLYLCLSLSVTVSFCLSVSVSVSLSASSCFSKFPFSKVLSCLFACPFPIP